MANDTHGTLWGVVGTGIVAASVLYASDKMRHITRDDADTKFSFGTFVVSPKNPQNSNDINWLVSTCVKQFGTLTCFVNDVTRGVHEFDSSQLLAGTVYVAFYSGSRGCQVIIRTKVHPIDPHHWVFSTVEAHRSLRAEFRVPTNVYEIGIIPAFCVKETDEVFIMPKPLSVTHKDYTKTLTPVWTVA